MPSLLDKIGAEVTKAVVGAKLWYPCTVYRATVVQDDGGDTTTTYAELPCKGFVEEASYSQKQSEGFIDGDVRVLIMRQTLSGRKTLPDDEFVCNGGPWSGRRWSITGDGGDPAGATITLRGRKV